MNTTARIATVCQASRFFRTVEENRAHVLNLLDLTLRVKPDLVCLPENFSTVGLPRECAEDVAETVPGPTVDAVAAAARRHGCYVICPLLTRRDGACWNSAVVIDRTGGVAGVYDKIHPVTGAPDYTVLESGIAPGRGVPVYDLDFGRIGIHICFDIGFPETWAEMARQEARVVFWPSAYDGGFPLQVFAALHGYWVISSVRTERSKIIDPMGTVRGVTDRLNNVVWTDLNLDYAVCHYDFNFSIPDKILAAYGDRVAIQSDGEAGRFLVQPTDRQVTVAALQREFGFETMAQYHERHRDAYGCVQRGESLSPQQAAHGERRPYAKW